MVRTLPCLDGNIVAEVVVSARSSQFLGGAVVEKRRDGADTHAHKARRDDHLWLEVGFPQHPCTPPRQGVVNLPVLALVLKAVTHGGFRRHAPEVQGFRKIRKILEAMDALKAGFAAEQESVQAAQDVFFGDQMVFRPPMDADHSKATHARKRPNGQQLGIADDRLIGRFMASLPMSDSLRVNWPVAIFSTTMRQDAYRFTTGKCRQTASHTNTTCEILAI